MRRGFAVLLAGALTVIAMPLNTTLAAAATDPAQEVTRLTKQLNDDQAKLDALNDQALKAQAELDRLNRALVEERQQEQQLGQQMSELARAAYERPPQNVSALLQPDHPGQVFSNSAQARLAADKQRDLLAAAERLRLQDEQTRDQQAARLSEIKSARDQAEQVAISTLALRNAASDQLVRARAQAVADQAKATQAAAVQPAFPVTSADVPVSNHFPGGYCTWYVASRRSVPWYGNAIDWWENAKPYGYKEGQVPVVGAIMVTRESVLYGHVAYVEAVNTDGSWTVSEMNFQGWNVKSARTLRANQVPLVGFIYGKP